MAENKLSSPKSNLILIFVILFTIVAALIVVAFLTSVEKSSPVVVQPTVTPTITLTPEPTTISSLSLIKNVSELNKEIKKECPLSVLHERSAQGKTHVIFNNKDLGEGLVYNLSGNKPLYWDKDKNIIYDGKNYGEGGSVAIDGDNIAFVRYGYDENKSWQPHIIYNGENIGVGEGPKMDKGHLVFVKGGHIIYDGKDLGEGEIPQIKGNNIAYIINSKVVYNGKELGNIWGSGSLHIYDDGVFFSQQNNNSIWYNGRDIKEVNGLIRNVEGDNVLFEKITTGVNGGNHVFLNEKDLGEGGNAQMKNGHIAWVNGNDVYFDGIYVGKGQGSGIDGKNILYKGEENGIYSLIFNGNNLGVSATVFFATLIEDNVVYTKDDNLFCNSVDLGKFICDKAHEHGQCLYTSLKE